MHGIPYPCSTSSALAKLTKGTTSAGPLKQQGEKKETPQERLKRIMSKQLNKQSMPYYKRGGCFIPFCRMGSDFNSY